MTTITAIIALPTKAKTYNEASASKSRLKSDKKKEVTKTFFK